MPIQDTNNTFDASEINNFDNLVSWEPSSISAEDFWGQFTFGINGGKGQDVKEVTGYLRKMSGIAFSSTAARLEKLKFPNLVDAGLVNVTGVPLLKHLDLPELITVGYPDSNNLTIDANNELEHLWLNSLVSVASILNIRDNPKLLRLSLDRFKRALLVRINNNTSLTYLSLDSFTGTTDLSLNITGNTALQQIVLTNWLPNAGSSPTANFSGNALNAQSVNHILARAVAANVSNYTINLSGGTNAAPTGQGITDKNTLVANSCTITTN